jgi:hypothetical protein
LVIHPASITVVAGPWSDRVRILILLALLAIAAAAHGAAADDVRRAFESVLASGGFRGQAQGNVFGPDLPALAGEVEVVFPDRIHVRTDALEFIALPDRAWIETFGVWVPTERDLLPVTAFDMAALRRSIGSIRDVRAQGAAALAACRAHVYAFRSSGRLPGAASSGEVRAWICDGSARLARVEARDTRGGRMRFDFDWSRRAVVHAPAG